MKTRIIHTKIWQDSWFSIQELDIKIYFLYLLTNEYMDISFFQEIPVSVESSDTKIPIDKIHEIKKYLKKEGKIIYYKDYLYLCNGYKYANYSGIKNSHSKLRTLFEMSDDIIKKLEIPIKKTLDDIFSDLEDTKAKNYSEIEKTYNLLTRLLKRLSVLGIEYQYQDTPIPIEGRNKKLEIRNKKTEKRNKKDVSSQKEDLERARQQLYEKMGWR